jgi:hypothetical protein
MPAVQSPLIFTSTNHNYVHNFKQAGAGRGTYVGMCGGLSTLWLNNMLGGVRDINSKPDEGRAQLLQVKYRWDKSLGGQDAINLLASAGLIGTTFLTRAGISMAGEEMASKGGGFLIWNGPHFVAAFIRPGQFYFYDCETGLYLYETKSDWKAQIGSLGYGSRFLEPWTVWSVTK